MYELDFTAHPVMVFGKDYDSIETRVEILLTEDNDEIEIEVTEYFLESKLVFRSIYDLTNDRILSSISYAWREYCAKFLSDNMQTVEEKKVEEKIQRYNKKLRG